MNEANITTSKRLRLGSGVGTGIRGRWAAWRRSALYGSVPLDRIIDLTTMDGDLLGGLHAQSHFVAANFDDDNRDVIVDDDAFVLLPRQHQHDDNPFVGLRREITRLALRERSSCVA